MSAPSRIFVVEDEALIAMELEDHLTTLGYLVCGSASRGDEALKRIPAARPDLVLMDINLGSGPNGIEVARGVLDVWPVPIIFLTAYSDAEVAERVADVGSYSFHVKPYKPWALHANIQAALRRHALERELRAANQRLAAGEDRFRRVTDNVSDALVVCDGFGRITFVNRRFEEMFGGVDGEEVSLWSHVSPSSRDEVRRRHMDLLAGDAVVATLEYNARHRDGSALWIEADTVAVRDEQGRISGSQWALREVSARRRMDDALAFLSAGLGRFGGDELLETTASSLAKLLEAEIAFVGQLVGSDPPRLRIAGLCVDDRVQKPVEFDVTESPWKNVLTAGEYVAAAGTRDRVEATSLVRRWDVESTVCVALKGAGAKPIGVVGVMGRRPLRDPEPTLAIVRLFATQTASELERRGSTERFERLFEFSPDAVLMVDEGGRILMASKRVEALFGYSPEELRGQPIETLVPDASREIHVAKRGAYVAHPRLRTMGSASRQLTARRRNGAVVPVDVSLNHHRADGRLFVIAAVRDVSDRVREQQRRAKLEAQLRHAERLKVLGTLAGGIAHDFNNILGAIVGNVAIAKQQVTSAREVAESLDRIGVASQRASGLVQKVLAFSRPQPVAASGCALEPAIREALDLLRAGLPADVMLVVELSADAPLVVADATQIHQVITNLVTNARDAIGSGPGRIEVRLDTIEVGEASDFGLGLRPGRHARVRVIDDGCGMDEATIEHLFDPFFTTKGPGRGTGLGLSIVHGIVTERGGAIAVDSGPGRGTAMTLYFPEAEAEHPADVEAVATADEPFPAAGPAAEPGRRNVLFLDDDGAIVDAATRLLALLGFEAVGYVSPLEALEHVRAEPRRFDLVITDYRMGEMSGVDVARAVTELRPDLPVLLVSGYHRRSEEEIAAAGIRHTLDKPFDAEGLRQAIARTLDGT